MNSIPEHVGIIMDGNGRWSTRNCINLKDSYSRGAEVAINTIKECIRIEIKHLTLFAFSINNWKRNKSVVDLIMSIGEQFIDNLLDVCLTVKITFIGEISSLSDSIKSKIALAEKTRNEGSMRLYIALNYDGKHEIYNGVKTLLAKHRDDNLVMEDLNKYINPHNIPEMDLMIRTGGDKRLSGFMTWLSTFSELYFTDTLWPDFSSKELEEAILYYRTRKRNFGDSRI
ncbi:Ditrans,polycis-undecaprenyl-diphosphate synthase ((2E,6E)-farnesyl-diphosphate specific) [Candidatus Fokinia solitaria]|uniref:Isoprenyl transferase n=1 Tax=Candidatus Fokinia solitaria TaxID=1802984 RepID=A0A2U8BRL3_9RICK|nr:polyprenyl diphosphate synthase [Candidatus Fokinia solitaria]AWD32996.1 Ditrans,polycis-undecaprenyl-diphosphate synthase ((2E,6E)-farnesyl-diphosphate specific) [Candidatus Fokinia solitaria]